MKSTFQFPTFSQIISYEPFEKSDDQSKAVKYGPYKDVEPFTSHSIYIHATYNTPIPIFKNVTRTITVSHWNNIHIDEFYEITNEVAALSGEFGRVDYNEQKTVYALNNLQSILPKFAHSLYYVDAIGNISTSNAFRDTNEVNFKIQPRFPIMGGWKTSWNQGYSLPSKNYIKYRNDAHDTYVFTTQLSHQFREIVAEDFTVKIILPEGATDIAVNLPYTMEHSVKEVY